jgi:hypothetical protein
MDYDELIQELPKILEVTELVPEPYRERCFEVLLRHFLSESGALIPQISSGQEFAPRSLSQAQAGTPQLNPQLRAFMKRTGITQEEIEKLVIYENGECHFVFRPTTTTTAQGVREWAMLLTLASAIKGNGFTVDPNELRSICDKNGYYETSNYSKAFGRYESLFKVPFDVSGGIQQLADDGEAALVKLIRSLIAHAP